MPYITTCTNCGDWYEESSEETANHPTKRLCPKCHQSEVLEYYADHDKRIDGETI